MIVAVVYVSRLTFTNRKSVTENPQDCSNSNMKRLQVRLDSFNTEKAFSRINIGMGADV